MLYLLALIILIVLIIWYHYNLYTNTMPDVPGPKPIPFIGNLLILDMNPARILDNLNQLMNTYGSTMKVWRGNEPVVITMNPDHIEQILKSNTNITKSNTYFILKEWLGEGLLLSTGTKWKRRRKIMTPAYHFKILERFIHVFDSCTDVLVDKLERNEGNDVNIYQHVNLCSLDIICETSMGVSINAQKNINFSYTIAVNGFLEIASKRTFDPLKQTCLFRISKLYVKYKKFLNDILTFTNRIIDERRNLMKTDRILNEMDDNKHRIQLLDLLLMESEKDPNLTKEDIREEIDTFMFEGHDTISSALSFTIYELSKHYDIQTKIYEEIKEVIGDDKITYRHLQELKYLEMVLKEVLRLYPSVPMISRKLEEECRLDDNILLPKGTIIAVCIYAMQRSPTIYEQPLKFDPDRFLPENRHRHHNFGLIPFSAGPRNCIGQKFAMLEMKMAVIKILKRFILLPSEHQVKLIHSLVLKSSNGIFVKLKKRL